MRPWSQRRVLVTGGAGFIGSHLVRRLASLGARVVVADNLVRGSMKNLHECLRSVELAECDLTNEESCMKVCDGVGVVFHLASRVGGINYYLRKPGEVIAQNTLMDGLMVKAAVAKGITHLVYASSAHVYPERLQTSPDAPLLKEEDALPAQPGLSYGWAKLFGEKLLEYVVAEGTGLGGAILRLIGVYGEHQDADLETGSAIPVFMRRAIEFPKRRPFSILGTGEETRSYCYVGDVVDAMVLAAEKVSAGALLGPLNVGSEERVKIGDLAKEIIAISGKDIEVVKDVSHRTMVWGQALDCSRARETLNGWQPRVPLHEGLRRTYAHMRERMRRSEPV